MFQKIKEWIIRKLGGYTAEEFGGMVRDYLSKIESIIDKLSYANSNYSLLCKQYLEQQETLEGLKILEAKIETFQAKGAFPYVGRSGIQLQRRIAEKKTAVVNKLVSDILQQNRFFVIEINEESNKIDVTATISVLEGGVIGGKEAQLPQDGEGAGDPRESGETPQDD